MNHQFARVNRVRPFGSTWLPLLVALPFALGTSSCNMDKNEGTERWVATAATNVKIDWDKVNKAYKKAEGPADFEEKINEIYEGDEIISVAVEDTEDRAQTVTGFFDNNTNGKVEDDEKIFTIKREVTSGDNGQYQINGHGPHYGYYHSPMYSLASGMLMGAMISSMFRPSYVPVAYVTSPSRRGQIVSHRKSYRAKNPSKYSKSGRRYNSKGTRSWGSSGRSSGRRSGGGGFGIRNKRRREDKPERLTA